MNTTAVEPEETREVEFRIVSQAFDSWNVQFCIDMVELVNQQGLLRHLRRIKKRIAVMHSLPESAMVFDGILRKSQLRDSVDVIIRIKKQLFEKGNPKVHFKDGLGLDESKYSHMTALLDIMYIDQFEKPVTLDRVMKAVGDARIKHDYIDDGIIVRKVEEILKNQIPLKNIQIAKGKFPDIGVDAELEFFFQALVEPGKTDQYYSSRRVSKGDYLCRKTPPRTGQKEGENVLGDKLPPREGLDIQLRTSNGAVLSLDGNDIVAESDGVVVISRSMKKLHMVNGVKEIPDFIQVKVNPVLKVDGNKILDIATSQTVEIIGDLKMGSKILTDCEVYVSGDVEDGTLIEASDDVIVEGNVKGGTLSSQSSVIAQHDVSNSRIVAKDQIIVKGTVRNSDLTGDKVSADSVIGSKVLAQSKITLQRIDADENNIMSTIMVGMFDFFSQRIKENEEFLEKARANLLRIEMLVGKELMEQVTPINVQTMLMRFLAKHRMNANAHTRQQVDIYRKLIESIPPTQALIEQKESENIELLRKVAEREAGSENVVIIREKMAAKAVFSVNGVEAAVDAVNKAVEVRSDKENLILTPLPAGERNDPSTREAQ